MGRYVYPLEEGGTDEAALSFWTTNDVVEQTLSIRLELKSTWPVVEVRAPAHRWGAINHVVLWLQAGFPKGRPKSPPYPRKRTFRR